jgi:hypothetical protein
MPRRNQLEESAADDLLVNLNARISKALWRRMRVRCVQEGRLLRDFITEALKDQLKTLNGR